MHMLCTGGRPTHLSVSISNGAVPPLWCTLDLTLSNIFFWFLCTLEEMYTGLQSKFILDLC